MHEKDSQIRSRNKILNNEFVIMKLGQSVSVGEKIKYFVDTKLTKHEKLQKEIGRKGRRDKLNDCNSRYYAEQLNCTLPWDKTVDRGRSPCSKPGSISEFKVK